MILFPPPPLSKIIINMLILRFLNRVYIKHFLYPWMYWMQPYSCCLIIYSITISFRWIKSPHRVKTLNSLLLKNICLLWEIQLCVAYHAYGVIFYQYFPSKFNLAQLPTYWMIVALTMFLCFTLMSYQKNTHV